MEIILSPSILAADFAELRRDVNEAEKSGVNTLHFDIMDGTFVPNISFGAAIMDSLRDSSDSFFDVHMMVENPERYFLDMKKAGAQSICIHEEATKHLDRAINQIKEMDLEAGVALNPATPIDSIVDILPIVDMVLIMSVNPGFGGQKLIGYTLDKIRRIRDMRDERDLSFHVAIDGGVTLSNIDRVLASGADFIVAGSSIFKPKDRISENVMAMLNALEKVSE